MSPIMMMCVGGSQRRPCQWYRVRYRYRRTHRSRPASQQPSIYSYQIIVMAPASNLAAFLVLSAAATPACDAFAFTPSSPRLHQPIVSFSSLSVSNQDENEVVVVDGWRKMTGGAAAFLTGIGIMAQVAFADPSGVASIDTGEFCCCGWERAWP